MKPTERSYRRLFWSLALVGLLLDQATKYEVFHQLNQVKVSDRAGFKGSADVVPGVFELLAQFTPERDDGKGALAPLRTWSSDELPYVNKGALAGRKFGLSDETANVIFAVVSVLAAAAIIFWSTRKNTGRERFLCLSLGLILAGTLGNLYDRVVFGGVRDFLHWFYVVDWPVFNVADCCLVCGAGFLLLQAFFAEPKKSEATSDSSAGIMIEETRNAPKEPAVAEAN